MPMTASGPVVLERPKATAPPRRFTDKPSLDPAAVMNLPRNHPALEESRTLFPTTVVDIDEEFDGNLLVSGRNNRKLGDKIAKGKFKGYALYGLSLEERATCPADCTARAYCYGNGMQLARRHRIKDQEFFFTLLAAELEELFETEQGVMVRLHVLGDFPNADYVYYWNGLLERFPKLACYGYTHRRESDNGGDEIGGAIAGVKAENPDRFRIRWSREAPAPDSAIIIDQVPEGPRFNGAIVCPAQTDATACCASCGLCWERASAKETIAFIKHGRKLEGLVAEAANLKQRDGLRPVSAITLRTAIDTTGYVSEPPELRLVDPKTLLIETVYQRDLSPKSINLIRKTVASWDWAKFKPPICSEADGKLVIVDGQHTAIAAASHPAINQIPVMVTRAKLVERRAAAFVSHNRDRLVMTPAQIFYGDLAAGDKEAKGVMECAVKTGASVPRLPIAKGEWKPGQVSAISEIRAAFRSKDGRPLLERMLRIAVAAKAAPISATILKALRILLTDQAWAETANLPDGTIATAIVAIGDIATVSEQRAAELGISRFSACAELIAENVR